MDAIRSSVIDKDLNKFFQITKRHKPYFMTITCDTTKIGKKTIPAAVHPFDKTGRPQLVTKKSNENYYNLINEFKKITGVGVLLNTSFNLHGEPIVFSQGCDKDTQKSGLKYLFLEIILLKK